MAPASAARWPLREAVARLERAAGKPRPLRATDPFDMILWDGCAYLVDDDRRARVYARLKQATGNDPERIAGMKPGALATLITEDGGMQPAMRAEKLQRAADLVLDVGRAELARLCREEPKRARALLKKFRGIADPGADRILMVSGSVTTLGVESNGLRVLRRLGYGTTAPDYTREYRSVANDIAPELPVDPVWLLKAHQLLRQHGRTVCKTSAPRCGECGLAPRCPSANRRGS
jgi:endonuclease-3